MKRERDAMFSRYVKSKRHTMQVDYDQFMGELDAERAAGQKRAKDAGPQLPIPPRAEAVVSIS
jgi:uncharacterized protein VirK/YbjX